MAFATERRAFYPVRAREVGVGPGFVVEGLFPLRRNLLVALDTLSVIRDAYTHYKRGLRARRWAGQKKRFVKRSFGRALGGRRLFDVLERRIHPGRKVLRGQRNEGF